MNSNVGPGYWLCSKLIEKNNVFTYKKLKVVMSIFIKSVGAPSAPIKARGQI